MSCSLPGERRACKVIANGQIVCGAMEAEVISNNYYAADRFRASVALGIDPWAGASFWASEPDILLDVQFSLDGGASFVSLVQGVVDSVSIDPTLGLVRLDGRDLTSALIEARTQETFANRTSSEIASLLAQRHNLTPQVIATTTPVGRYYQSEHDRITLNQFSRTTTEWDLLVFLARQEGFDVFVQGQTLYFQPAAQAGGFCCIIAARGCDRSQAGAILDPGTRYRSGNQELEFATKQRVCSAGARIADEAVRNDLGAATTLCVCAAEFDAG